MVSTGRASGPLTAGSTIPRYRWVRASRMCRRLVAAVLLLVAEAQADLLHTDLASDLISNLTSLGTAENTSIALAGLGLAGATHLWDNDVDGELTGPFLAGSSRVTDVYGSSEFNLPASLAVWGAGRLLQRDKLAATGVVLLRTLTVTQLVVAPIKVAVARRRPDGSNRLSFPSGHTANSFAVARAMHRCYGKRLGIPLYGLGVLVAAGRIEGRRHFLSDVAMGAVLGTIVGGSVTLDESSRLQVRPAFTGSGPMLSIRRGL